MSRHHATTDAAPILAAAANWGRLCLLEDGSVLSPNLNLWTAAHLAELDAHFVRNLDEGEGSYLDKLQAQLAPASPEARALMAELHWLHLLVTVSVSPGRKREDVATIWGWSGLPLDQGQEALSDAALHGLANPGTAYNTHRHREMTYLIGMAQAFKRLDPDRRHAVLGDPWAFARWLAGVPQEGNRQSRHILRHLLFPDTFERIVSVAEKQHLVSRLDQVPAAEVRGWDDERLDRALLALRGRLEAETGRPVDLYEPDIQARWKEAPVAPSDRTWLLGWNPTHWTWSTLADARAATARGELVTERWRCANGAARVGDTALLVRVGIPPKGLVAIGRVTTPPFEAPHYDPQRAAAGVTTTYVQVAFSSVRDAEQDPIVPLDVLEREAPGHKKWAPQSSGIYVGPEAAARALALWEALPSVAAADAPAGTTASSAVELPVVAEPVNLIFYGPPGTGKTYRMLSAYVGAYQDGDGPGAQRRYEFVTFHQSYAYEDFVEGIRPVTQGGAVTYEVRPGVFRVLCDRARRNPGRRYALFVDEINRGNVARILGELITLLEPDKRATYDVTGRFLSGLEVTLPTSGERFGVPRNLDLYATMNTADRSVALLDAALRRRFRFEELMPTAEAIPGADGEGGIPDGEGGTLDLRRLLRVLNERLTHLLHRDQTIGHACLMGVRDFPGLRRVLAQVVLPLLQECFHDDWDRIRAVLADDTSVDAEHQLVRRVTVQPHDLFPGSGDPRLAEGVRYAVTPELAITPDAVRKVYEPLA